MVMGFEPGRYFIHVESRQSADSVERQTVTLPPPVDSAGGNAKGGRQVATAEKSR